MSLLDFHRSWDDVLYRIPGSERGQTYIQRLASPDPLEVAQGRIRWAWPSPMNSHHCPGLPARGVLTPSPAPLLPLPLPLLLGLPVFSCLFTPFSALFC